MSPEERAALVNDLRHLDFIDTRRAADLIEADAARLAAADKAIADAPHDRYCGLERAQQPTTYCNCWKSDYDAAKEAL